MQHNNDVKTNPISLNRMKSDHILKKYPELLLSLNYVTGRSCDASFSGKRRILRRNRIRKRFKNLPNLRVKQFENALFNAMDTKLLFSCPVCRNLLSAPVTVECGHTFCGQCLDNFYKKCIVCGADVGTEPKSTNVLVQDLVQLWRERNKALSIDEAIPNTADILGIEPRYHLRSGFAGLQIKENKIYLGKLAKNQKIEDISSRKFNNCLKEVFIEIDNIKQKALKSSWENTVTVADLECILCSRCILDPVTTNCGHTFCRNCLTRVLDHGLSCPLCMATLSVADYSRGSNFVLDQAIKFLIPNEYSKRLLLNLKEERISVKNSDLPVFVCTNAFPGVACPLYVYEPRYRLLVRRCLSSPVRKFAMAAKQANGEKFVSYGTVLEVKDAVFLEDGSFILTTLGSRRFKVLSKNEEDGYDTAKVQYIKDTAVPAEKLPELLALHQKVYNKAAKWILSLTPKVLAEVERLIGKMPKVERNWYNSPDGPSWTWWLMPILPLSSQLQVGFLSTTNLEKRLRAIDKMLEHMKIRMKALERDTLEYSAAEDASESCSDLENAFSS